MINLLEHYFWQSLPQTAGFTTHKGLESKVDAGGKLKPYAGNTTVFLLDDTLQDTLAALQDSLYEKVPDMLAEPLKKDTFHMTLHSLVDGIPDMPGLEEKMDAAAEKAKVLLDKWKDGPDLHMRTSWLFNMMNTSIVLGLMPADPQSWQWLDEMYTALEAVVPLGYAMTPHITMAYYRPGVYEEADKIRLGTALRNVDMELSLPQSALVLQNFTDMNHYQTVR